MQSDPKTFIDSNPDPRELKRALAVQMVQQGYVYTDIQAVLQVSVGFITKWKQNYEAEGVKGLRLAYQGRKSYLNDLQRQAVIEWLQQKQYWQLLELVEYVDQHYGVVFASRFLPAFGPIREHFHPKHHELSTTRYREQLRQRLENWREVVGLNSAVIRVIKTA
jgi:putative transposase